MNLLQTIMTQVLIDQYQKLYDARPTPPIADSKMIARSQSGLPGLLLAVLVLTSAIALSACSSTSSSSVADAARTAATELDQKSPTETDRLNAWFEQKFEEQLQRSPLYLTVLGRKEQYDKLDDASEAADDKEAAIAERDMAELRANFDYDKLTQEAQLSYDIWVYQHTRDVAARKFRDHNYVFDQMSGIQSFFPTFMINYHRVDERSDMEAYIARLGEIANAVRTLLGRAQKYAAGGVRPPRFAYDGVLDQSSKIIEGAPFDNSTIDSAIWSDVKTKLQGLSKAGKVTEAEAAALQARAQAALLEEFGPAYQELIAWFESDRNNTASIASGVGSSLPRGKAYYAERLRYSTTTDMSAAEVHALGLAEVERLTGEMQAVMDQVEFKGSLQDFFRFIREDDRFYYPDTDAGRQQYIDDAEAKLDFIRKRLPDYFGVLPKGDVVVKRVEAFREQDGAAQHYSAGTPDGSRPGIYYVHLSDMTAVPANQLEVIAYHEGLPGHHMQIAIAQELESMPTFRRQISFTPYVEGWALYSEWLATEMGAYEDPYANFGRITSELWRAIRLVVDTGLHAFGWTEQQAIDYFASNSPEPLESITSEVQRYIVTPGQATSYKIGMLKIRQLRNKAEAELGDAFDIRGFHDTVLGGGALPLALLERRVDNWIKAQKS